MENQKSVLIIAEAGVNHNGSLVNALQLIDVAADAGADMVKFQTFSTELVVSQKAEMADYQKANMNQEGSQWDMIKKLEIPVEWYPQLLERCQARGIRFFSTGFDKASVDMLLQWNPGYIKIPSGEMTNLPLLRHIASKNVPVIMSTGMCNLHEVKVAMQVLLDGGLNKEDVIVLQCNTEYPTPMKDVNLGAMQTMQREFDVRVGYSDHTLGIEASLAAVALGAVCIEKHFTLSQEMEGPDHVASLNPGQLRDLVCGIRNIEKVISGSGIKVASESERKNIAIARRSIHVTRDIEVNDILQEGDLIALRPGDGISPMHWDEVKGRVVIKRISKGEKLNWEMLQ
ncbi:MAG: N-acetylneuraminate synthase [Bacteroidetes bacterium]|nr:N-acetylneuraminate synthase [Bacteroidota bacterium]